MIPLESYTCPFVQNFQHTDLTIVTAYDGHDAIKQYQNEKPDIILMDIRMPNMDGYEAASKIRELDSTVPIIALTASIMKDEYERMKSQNFDGYLRKPVLRDELFLELGRFLSYDKVDEQEENIEDTMHFEFTKNTLLNVSKITDELQKVITPLYMKVKQSNNISDMKLFISKVHALALEYDIDVLKVYATRLDVATDAFDISQMQFLLSEYSKFEAQFKSD